MDNPILEARMPSPLLPQVRAELKSFEGQPLTPENRKAIEAMASEVRFVGHGMATTMEHRGGRVTVRMDAGNVITSITKG